MSQKSRNQISPLDAQRETIEKLATQGLGAAEIATRLEELGTKTSERSVRRALSRWGVTVTRLTSEMPGVTIQDDTAEVTSSPYTTKRPSHDQLMKDRGLDSEEWEVVGMTVNEWEGPSETGKTLYRQLKLQLRRRLEIALPDPAERVPGEYIAPKKTLRKLGEDGELVVFTGDQQAPFHDPELHSAFCEWLAENTPEKGVLIGDTVDFPDISRHRLNPEGTAKVQECINAGYNILRDYVEASPDTEWIKLAGNHDERIRNTMIDWAVELYDVKRAKIEDQEESSVLSVEHLLRLDELGIQFIDPQGGYQHAQVNVSSNLAARHGWLAVKGSGASALKTLDHLGYSIVVGHTHRQGLVHKTTHDINGEPTTLAAVETGCMCLIQDGLGYAVAPDWQNGFATARVWADGKFKLDVATYVDDVLLWRDQRYG